MWLLLPRSRSEAGELAGIERTLSMLHLSWSTRGPVAVGSGGIAFALEDGCSRRGRGELIHLLLPFLRSYGLALYMGASHISRPIRHIISDLDGTLVSCEVMVLLARIQGIEETMQRLTSRAMSGGESFEENFSRRTEMLRGLSLQEVEDVVRHIAISSSLKSWLRQLSQRGITLEVASGAYRQIVEGLCGRMEVRHYCASQVEVAEGRLTGRLLRIVGAEEKASFVRMRLEALGLERGDILTIGDGANDLQMLQESAHALLYQAELESQGLSLADVWGALPQLR